MFTSAPAAGIHKPVALKKPTIEEIAAGIKVGLILHDNPKALAEGWAFPSNGEPFRVRGIFELPNDAIWISSGDFQDFRKLGGAQYHHLRRTGYLGMKLSEIAKDLGVRIDGSFAQDGGRLLAPYVEDVVRKCVEFYKLEDPMRQLQEDTLVATIAKVLPPPMPHKELFLSKLSSAYQSWSSLHVPYMDDTATVRMRFARIEYANWLLSNPVPDNGWTHVYSDSGFNHEAVMNGTFPPTLIEAVLELDSVNAETAELIAYGVGGSAKTRSKRSWMTDVEYRWISKFARVHVRSYLMSNEMLPLSDAYSLPADMTSEKFYSQTVSMGIISYIHWQALVSAKYTRLTNRSEYDLHGTWLRAYDRAKCFEAAYLMQQHGFSVVGYGNGSVVVRAQRDRLEDLCQLSLSLGMCYPTWNALLQEFGYGSPETIY